MAVVGGGPAGLHAAALLSARGFRVVLFEEHHAIGEPVHCTGLIAAETYEQFDLPADSVLNRLRTVRFYPPSRQVFEYTTDRDEPLVVNRALFDRRLAERARERGVLMRIGVGSWIWFNQEWVKVRLIADEDEPAVPGKE